jgi:hypothetical protein
MKHPIESILPVVRLTLKEYHDLVDGHPSKRMVRVLTPLEGKMLRYEITDLQPCKALPMDLYFILHGNFVKIGQAVDPNKRLTELQVGTPEKLKILAIIPKMGSVERFCHKKFKHLHSRGEWFKYTEEIDSFIEELKKKSI